MSGLSPTQKEDREAGRLGEIVPGFLPAVIDLEIEALTETVEPEARAAQDEVQARQRIKLVQTLSFAEMLARIIGRYHNRAIETLQVIEELMDLAREMQAARERDERLGLSADDEEFYDALGVNDSAIAVLGDEMLKLIAQELVEMVRANLTIVCTMMENVRARLRVYVKRVLRRHGYPPDKQEQATQTVLQ